jgi:hypothetical protein
VLPAVLLPAALLAGCSDDDPAADPSASPTTAAPAAAPAVGACYRLTVDDALQPTNADAPVPCTGRHTSETVYVGTLDPTFDGHLLALDAARVQREVARRCRARVDAHVGGGTETQRLSRVQAVWFSPSLRDADRGATWFRCDVVIGAGSDRFAPLPRRTRRLLARPGALDRWGTCGTAAPSAAGFERVLCSARHTWRARATVTLPAATRYLSKKAGALADTRCRDVAVRMDPTSSTFRWSFEWPTTAQWKAGQRYGLCWIPR